MQAASADLERAEAHLARFGPLAALRRTLRMERDDAEHAVARAQQRLEAARAERRRSEGRVAELEAAEAERTRFVADTAWRLERVQAINNQLDRHWSAAVLAAVRQDDPLSFGVGRLRAARAVAARDLASYHASLPPDRRAAVTQAERELADARHRRRLARRALDECRRRLELASERHWGRRDKEAMARAERALASAEHAVSDAARAEHDARGRLDAEGSKVRRRTKALAATEERRVELTGALAELDAALDDTRAKRVEALAAEPIVPPHLVDVVGEAPSDPHAARPGGAWPGASRPTATAVPTPSATRPTVASSRPSGPVRPHGGCPTRSGTTSPARCATAGPCWRSPLRRAMPTSTAHGAMRRHGPKSSRKPGRS